MTITSISAVSPIPAVPPQTLDAADVLVGGSVSTLIGRIGKHDLGFAGRIKCVVHLSFGDLEISTNRDLLPIEIGPGDWAQLRMMRSHSGGVRLLAARRIDPPAVEMAWLPTVRHHRFAMLLRLRSILGRLGPAAQATFVVAMSEPRTQSRFLMGLAATDHHTYPGGLFDQAVKAAGRAFHAPYANDRERDIATLAALFHDIGKTWCADLNSDLERIGSDFAPHWRSRDVLVKVISRTKVFDAELSTDLLAQFASAGWMNEGSDAKRDARIRDVVQKAVVAAWRDEFPEDRRWPRAGT